MALMIQTQCTEAGLVERIDVALSAVEYARLIGDRQRALASMYEAFGLHAALRRLEKRDL